MKRYAILLLGAILLFLPLTATPDMQDTEPPVPTGYNLLVLTHAQFELYVSGIYEGQVLMASLVQAARVVCVDPMMTRTDLAATCLAALPVIPDRVWDYAKNDLLQLRQVVQALLAEMEPPEVWTPTIQCPLAG